MTIRDLGYRPYEGARRPASHNTWVMLEHGLKRAWGSWLVKIAAFIGWIPCVVGMAIVGFGYWISRQMGAPAFQEDTVVKGLRILFDLQVWLFLSLVTVGAGAGAIAEDLAQKAFQFYFAKPVTAPQYFFGRVGAVAIYTFALTFVPAALLLLVFVGTAPPEVMLSRAGLILPTLIYSLVIAIVSSTCSVGLSSLSGSRALTMSAWILLFVVPHVLAKVVAIIGDFPWLYLTSIPALLGRVGDALYRVPPTDALRWYHAAPILVAVSAGPVVLALWRLRRAEVIA